MAADVRRLAYSQTLLGGGGGSAAKGCTCAIDEYYRSACEGLDFYGEHEGKRYCVLHFPGEKKKDDFEEVKKSKLNQLDYDFGGTVYPLGTSEFREYEFDANANFAGATFVGKADFSSANFSGERTDFSEARFSGEVTSFSRAQFSGEGVVPSTDFSEARFSGAETSFTGAPFGSALTSFLEATFVKEVDFTGLTVKEKAFFWGSKANPVFGSEAWARFNRCRIEKPEQFTFNTVLLHPGWFCNTDVRKVDFTDVSWYGMTGGPEGTLNEEIHALEARDVQSPHTLLSQACQRLATNAEENRDYPLANDFYYWSMEALRKAGWRRLGLIRTIYWLLSGYGVKPGHAFGVLVVIWLVFAALYVLVPSSQFYAFSPTNSGQVISDVGEATVYSLGTMARLNPEPKPDPGWFQFLVTVEGLLRGENLAYQAPLN